MSRNEQYSIISIIILWPVLVAPLTVVAQEISDGKPLKATKEALIPRRGEPYDVPTLRIRLFDESTGEPRRLTPVRIRFVSQWLPSSELDYNVADGLGETVTEAVTDDYGFFTIGATTIVPEGLSPAGDNPLFVPRFVYIGLGYKVSGGYGGSYIYPETIEDVRSGKLAYIEMRRPQEAPEADVSPDRTDVLVRPNADWTTSKMRVKRGDSIHVKATGTISLGRNGSCGPEGIGVQEREALMADEPLGALIAVIGDDNDDFILIGAETEFVSPQDGNLFFGVNEGELSDNSGSFSVQVRIRRQESEGPSRSRPD